ncbi:neuropeptide FF receptor 2-like isoform X2 [Actinia tenebrosa]|nr:neuropeptide FF receptor 2-like isoform X2 [Actinia tenebrosa]XP_031570705.1 neuropeptide FF receptor 2-like isoform X2 [Actinia tenebrosa]XP_031570706.1 neuropeptide FF receptor 2-like isoform X2 [Actinia tenebrosa]
MSFNNTTAAVFNGGCYSVRCIFSFTENSIIAAAFFAVVIVSLTGNISTCYVILTRKQLRSTASISTFNLALSDLLVTIVCAPVITIDIYVAKRWIFGEALCKIVPVVQKMSVNASIINLFVVSLEKFMAICFPFCFRARKKSFVYGIPFVWLLAIALAAPLAKYRQLIVTPSTSYCITVFPDVKTSRIFSVIYTLTFFIPLIMMICLQLTTIHSLSKRGITANISYMSQHNIRRKKAAVVLVIVMLSFLACWTPIYLLAMLNTFSEVMQSMNIKTVNVVYAVFTWMFYACAAVHPLIYFLMTPQGSNSLKRFRGTNGQKARRRLISKPSTAGSNVGGSFLLFTRESRV